MKQVPRSYFITMKTKTLNRTLTLLKTTFIVTFSGTIAAAIICLFFPTIENALITGTIIILLLFACIIEMFCYIYFGKEKSKKDSEDLSQKQNQALNNKVVRLQEGIERLEKDKLYYQRRCRYLEKKYDRESEKTDILSKLIENTFNQVLNNSGFTG